MKSILVPCDFFQAAQEAYSFAVQVANASKGKITVLKVIEIPMAYEATSGMPAYSFDAELIKELQKDDVARFEKLKEKFGTGSGDVTFETQYGYVTRTIEEFIVSKKIDLVIMGTQGSEGWEEYLIGSNTEKIVRRSPVPVMAIRKAKEISSIKNIVFPSLLESDQTRLVNKIKELQEFFSAQLHILFVNTPSGFKREADAQKALKEFAEKHSLKNFTLNVRNDTTEQNGIISFADERKADMIAMGTHGRKGLAHLFSGSITEDVVNHVNCAIWTFKI